MNGLVLRDVEVDGRRLDVTVVDGVIAQVGPPSPHPRSRSPRVAEDVDGAGGALLPGLHDHHLHLFAMASAAASIDCSPAAIADLDGLAAALRGASTANEWIRAVGYHESIAGDLDRHVLDRLVADRPVRVQHRGGALWVLNSAALSRVAAALDDSGDVERDAAGAPTGRLWRYDDRLRRALPYAPPDLAEVGRRLASYGITGATDATPDLDETGLRLLGRATETGAIAQRLTLLGAPLHADAAGYRAGDRIAVGPYKLHLRDHELPEFDDLVARIATAHAAGRPVAVHCVTRVSLLLTLAALAQAGPVEGDRIEHGSVVPPEARTQLGALGVRVVTQPDFLRSRGDAYLRDVDTDDVPLLYPYASLLAAGVATCAASDAPYGSADPWQVIASATTRRTAAGVVIGGDERVDASTALAGYLSAPDDPAGAPRRIQPGSPADLVLLDGPLAEALSDPSTERVRAVWIGGRRAA